MLRALCLLMTIALAPPALADVRDVRFPAIDGGNLSLAAFSGQPILVANTASLCGFTPQYEGLQSLWERYRDAGLMVIGVPTNDFGNQEPGTEAEIKQFCEVHFGIDFPLSAKVTTLGVDQHPFFAAVERDLGSHALPRWNFHKFLIGRDGELVAAWPSHVRPEDAPIVDAIEAALGASPS